METPSYFRDCVDFEDGVASYPESSNHERDEVPTTTTYDQSFPMYGNKMVGADVPFATPSRFEASKPGIWEGAVTTTELRDPDLVDMVPQQMFVEPRTYLAEHETMQMTLRDTPSTTPELQPSSRRTSSIKSESRSSAKSNLDDMTDMTPPEPSPPKRRKTTRKAKKEAAVNVEDDKRNKFLERNRLAASKCREKKKMFVSELEQTKIDLEGQHTRLQVEFNGLLGEVSSLKHTLMTHAKCNDPNIDSWISNEARKFVQTSQLCGKNPYVLDDGPSRGNGASAGFAHTRNSSTASSVAQHGGYGSFSSAGDRRDSIAYSQGTSSFDFISEGNMIAGADPAWTTTGASPPQTSPTDTLFPPLDSPSNLPRDGGMNFDHMPDEMLYPER
jgi:cyclic AMP-dependent transcription factor ATF-2